MPNTQETTAGDLAGQLITFMETGTPPDRLFTENIFCDFTHVAGRAHPVLGDAAIPPPADDDRDRAHGLEGGAVGRLSASRKGRPMGTAFFCRFELAEWT